MEFGGFSAAFGYFFDHDIQIDHGERSTIALFCYDIRCRMMRIIGNHQIKGAMQLVFRIPECEG